MSRFWPVGSWHEHVGLGLVRVVRHGLIVSPDDCYCGRTVSVYPIIHDGVREWSCYAPHCDLVPAPAVNRFPLTEGEA